MGDDERSVCHGSDQLIHMYRWTVVSVCALYMMFWVEVYLKGDVKHICHRIGVPLKNVNDCLLPVCTYILANSCTLLT